jgi:hypothetical protein
VSSRIPYYSLLQIVVSAAAIAAGGEPRIKVDLEVTETRSEACEVFVERYMDDLVRVINVQEGNNA